MARTEADIEITLAQSIKSEDRTFDTQKGPIYDALIRPVPRVLAPIEARVDRAERLATLQIAEVLDETEALQLARSFGIQLPVGRASRGFLTCFTTARPDIVEIFRGNIFGTTDGTFTYFASGNTIIEGAAVDSYFVSSRRRYEFRIRVEATGVGADYDVAEERITKVFTQIPGISGCVNYERMRGGLDPSDFSSTIAAVQAALRGLDPESGGGLASNIIQFDPDNVLGVSLVYPKDSEFKRISSRAAIDAYVSGVDADTHEFSVTAVGGEQTIALQKTPALSVESVRVNGNDVAFEFVVDTSATTGLSARATDSIRLTSALVTSDVLEVTQTYNLLHRGLQDEIFTEETLFDTDVLARMPFDVAIEVVADGTALTSSALNVSRIEKDVTDLLSAILEDGAMGGTYVPKEIEDLMPGRVSGLQSFRFLVFARVSGRLTEVETIALNKNQTALIDTTRLRISIHQ